MPAAEVDIDAELVRALLRDQHPDLADLALRLPGTGGEQIGDVRHILARLLELHHRGRRNFRSVRNLQLPGRRQRQRPGQASAQHVLR